LNYRAVKDFSIRHYRNLGERVQVVNWAFAGAPALLRRKRRCVRCALGGEFNAVLVAPFSSRSDETWLGKLMPLGDPGPNAPKWFAAVEMIRLAADQDWLHKVTKEIAKCWRNKRERRLYSLLA